MAELTKNFPIEVALAIYDPKGTYSVHAGVVMTTDLPDQDFLNALFLDSILHIPSTFNDREQEHDGKGVLLHLTGDRKPWVCIKGRLYEALYWQMYLKSAWGEGTTFNKIIADIVHTVSLNIALKEAKYWLARPFRKNHDAIS